MCLKISAPSRKRHNIERGGEKGAKRPSSGADPSLFLSIRHHRALQAAEEGGREGRVSCGAEVGHCRQTCNDGTAVACTGPETSQQGAAWALFLRWETDREGDWGAQGKEESPRQRRAKFRRGGQREALDAGWLGRLRALLGGEGGRKRGSSSIISSSSRGWETARAMERSGIDGRASSLVFLSPVPQPVRARRRAHSGQAEAQGRADSARSERGGPMLSRPAAALSLPLDLLKEGSPGGRSAQRPAGGRGQKTPHGRTLGESCLDLGFVSTACERAGVRARLFRLVQILQPSRAIWASLLDGDAGASAHR